MIQGQRLRRRDGWRLMTWVLACLAAGAPAGAQHEEAEQRRVTLEVNGWSLADVLSHLARQTGVEVVLRGGETPPITVRLRDVSLGDCLNALADGFSLLVSWERDHLVVCSLSQAVLTARQELMAGRGEEYRKLADLADRRQVMYGSEDLRRALAQALAQVAGRETLPGPTAWMDARLTSLRVAAANQPAEAGSAPAPDPTALTAQAVRGMVREGNLDGALALWNETLRGCTTLEAGVASAELFMALHYVGAPEAQTVWRASFDMDSAAYMLQEGWRQRGYQEALHLARLNIRYALTNGRIQAARMLQGLVRALMEGPRVVQVTCVVDADITADPRWEAKLRGRLGKCSDAFREQFGIEFQIVDLIRWQPPSDPDFDRQIAALKEALGPRRPELAIGFILEKLPINPVDYAAQAGQLWTGYGCPHSGAYLLARDFLFEYGTGDRVTQWSLPAGTAAETLTHEMGHMFGALHSEDPNSVMRAVTQGEPCFVFDDLNAQLIRLRKWQDISRGIASLDEPELLDLAVLYRRMAQQATVPNGAWEEAARTHLALARLYRRFNDPPRSVEQLEQVLRIGVPEDVVLEAQRMLARG